MSYSINKAELLAAKNWFESLSVNKRHMQYKTIKSLIDDALRKTIIIDKCDERENQGYDHLNDSDIMDILEECQKLNIDISRAYIDKIFQDSVE